MTQVTLMHGDAYEILPRLYCDAIVTDPPYGNRYGRNPIRSHKLGPQSRTQHRRGAWDDAPVDIDPIRAAAPKCVIWGGNHYGLPASRGWIVWHKTHCGLNNISHIEMAWTTENRLPLLIELSLQRANAERGLHPTQKPVLIMRKSIRYLRLPPGSVICDPFMGSGSAGIAALMEGMRFIGIEKDKQWYDLAARRIAEYQGLITQEAVI